MKKENKEMLKTILSNQELIMKALNIAIPVKKTEVKEIKKAATKKAAPKKVAAKKPIKKTTSK
jgi:hypothetical protein